MRLRLPRRFQLETHSNQFRMAIYDFGVSADTAALPTVFALSFSLTSAQTAAGTIDLMTVNGQNDNNDQDTNFDVILRRSTVRSRRRERERHPRR